MSRISHMAGVAALGLIVASSAHAAIVQNGSFETLTGPFVNSAANYMQLANGSTEIAGWTVSTTKGNIVLAQSPTDDGFNAAQGTYFVDLSGLGSESLDGALSQTISTVAGAHYAFSLDLYSGNNGTIIASVGGNPITLASGASFTIGNTSWTPWSGTFTGNALDTSPTLMIKNGTPGSQLDFVDNVSIVRTGGSVPEPAAWSLMILGFGLAGATLRRVRRAPLAA